MQRKIIPAVLTGLLFLTSCWDYNYSEPTLEHQIMTVGTTSVETSESYTASIKGRQDVEIYPQVSGTITRIAVTEGQRVKKGQVLFVIDQVPYQAELQTALAEAASARAQVEIARLTYDSKKELFAEEVISDYELSTARSSLAMAEATLSQAEANVLNARNSLSYTEVKSPADGIVGTLPYRAGALVGPTIPEPLTIVSDNSRMYVYFSMTENQLRRLLRNHGTLQEAVAAFPEVKLRLNDRSLYSETGTIESISGVVNPQTGTVSLRSVFPNPGSLLFSGSVGNIIIPMKMENVITIPQNVTYELQDRIHVYIYQNGTAHSREITVERINDGKIYIVTGGLSAGETIMADGIGFLRDGMQVKLKGEEK